MSGSCSHLVVMSLELNGTADVVLSQADTVERHATRKAFRALIRKVMETPLPQRGRCEVKVVFRLSALLSESGIDRNRLLGAEQE